MRSPKDARKPIALLALAALPVGSVFLLANGDPAPAARSNARPVASTTGETKKVSGELAAPVRAERPVGAVARAGAPATTTRIEPEAPSVGTPPAALVGLVTELRASKGSQAREVFDRIVAEPSSLDAPAFVAALLSVAKDPTVDTEVRCVALDLVGRAPAADAATVEKLRAIVASSDLDDETRSWATLAIRRLAIDRADLTGSIQEALLSALENAPAQARASLLDALKAQNASPAQVARLCAFLSSDDDFVRAGTARALASAQGEACATVTQALAKALATEPRAEVARALVDSALQACGRDALVLLASAQETAVVRSNPALLKRVASYRAALARGETDAVEIMDRAARGEVGVP